MDVVAPIVLISPAMAIPSRFYRPLVAAFEAQDWTARALGRRGFEPETPAAGRHSNWSYADEIADISDAVAQARAEEPDRPVVILGHSLGAQMAVASQHGQHPADGLVLIGASTPHHRYYPYAGLPMLAYAAAIPAVTTVVGHLPKPAFGAPGAATLMREWARFVRTGKPPWGSSDLVEEPSLVVHLQGDAYAVSAANKRFAEQFLSPDSMTRWVYTSDAAPEGGTTDHVHWVRRPEVVVDQIVGWWAEASSPALTD